jgi:sulfate adenylyltransferase
MSSLVSPHGSTKLRPLLLEGDALEAERARAATLAAIPISSREAGDLVMMGIGGFTPLAGFMGHDAWRGVCDDMRMANGVFWPIPITLSVDTETADGIAEGEDVALIDPETGEPLATMTVSEKYTIDKAHECQSVFKTTDVEHPGVAMVMEQGDVNLGGPVRAAPCSRNGVGPRWRHSRPATPCTDPTSISPRSASRWGTVSSCTRFSAA